MNLSAIVLHNFDPIALQIGPLPIRWYSLAYIFGVLLAAWMATYLNSQLTQPVFRAPVKPDDMILWVVFGIIIGGRLGYVLFYDWAQVQQDYWRALRTWDGGMSFHGGLIGLVVSVWLCCFYHQLPFLRVIDLISCTVPIGIFLGRIANFINGELYGRPTTVPWAVIFPRVDMQPRHPSQLYEALFEGLVLLMVMFLSFKQLRMQNRPGALSGLFLLIYGVVRIIIEYNYREPDVHLGLIYGIISMGQLLSIPMIGLGVFLLVYSSIQKQAKPDLN